MFKRQNHEMLTKGWILMWGGLTLSLPTINIFVGRFNFQPYEGVNFQCCFGDAKKET
jgi:hypothetical protein